VTQTIAANAEETPASAIGIERPVGILFECDRALRELVGADAGTVKIAKIVSQGKMITAGGLFRFTRTAARTFDSGLRVSCQD